MLMCLALLLIAAVVGSVGPFCPVSNHANFSHDGYTHYPLEIFNQRRWKHILEANTSHSTLRPCISYDGHLKKDDVAKYGKWRIFNHTSCPLYHEPSDCQITHKSVELMINDSAKWLDSSYFCDLPAKLANKSVVINIIVFGGSITAGAIAQGCCSLSECNYTPDLEPLGYPRCAWPTYFGRWLNETFPATVNVYNLAVAGYLSPQSADHFHTLFEDYPGGAPKRLTSNDIVFIDHSRNDVVSSNMQHYLTLMRGLEELILKIVSLAEGNNHDSSTDSVNTDSNSNSADKRIRSLPHIVLLDMYPAIPQQEQIVKCESDKIKAANQAAHTAAKAQSNTKYSNSTTTTSQAKSQQALPTASQQHSSCEAFMSYTVYSQIAQHYSIPLWSYRKAVLHGYNASWNSTEHPFLDYIRIHVAEIGLRNQNHPPWFVHLYYADLLAATLLHELRQCGVGAVSGHGVSGHTSDGKKHSTAHSNTAVQHNNQHQLPSRLTPFSEDTFEYSSINQMVCDGNKHMVPMLRISYDDVVQHRKYLGNFSMTPANLPHGWAVTTDQRGRGGFIRSLSPNATCLADNYARIVFELNMTVGEYQAIRGEVVLNVAYLRSYTNAGSVDVLVCGKQLTTLHALWDNYQDFKYSLPQTYKTMVPHGVCANRPLSERVSVELVHNIAGCESNTSTPSVNSSEPYGNQMFKLTSICVCKVK